MLQNPLQNLKDIHHPPPINQWPLAPGWWILSGFLLLLCFWAGWYCWHQFKHRQRKQLMLHQIQQTITDYQTSPEKLYAQLNVLLKQFVFTRYGREKTAALTGTSWLEFLDKTSGTQAFTQGGGRVLAQTIYQKHPKADLHSVCRAIEKWIDANV